MKPRAKKRFIFYSVIFLLIFFGYFLILRTFEQNIIYFLTPGEINHGQHINKIVRIGGFVKEGSLHNDNNGTYIFVISDGKADLKVSYRGALPNLFKEKQGVIAKGKIENGEFVAQEILAKHDEKYIPKDLSDKLKENGLWRDK